MMILHRLFSIPAQQAAEEAHPKGQQQAGLRWHRRAVGLHRRTGNRHYRVRRSSGKKAHREDHRLCRPLHSGIQVWPHNRYRSIKQGSPPPTHLPVVRSLGLSYSSFVRTFFCQLRFPHLGHFIYLVRPMCIARFVCQYVGTYLWWQFWHS